MLAAYPVHSMCKLLNFPGSFSFSRRESTQLAYDLDITDVKAIARSDPVSRNSIWLLLKHQFHNLPRTWGFHLTHESFLKALCNSVDLLHGQLFDHLAHDRVFGSFDLLSLSLALACSTRSTVISALRPSSGNQQ